LSVFSADVGFDSRRLPKYRSTPKDIPSVRTTLRTGAWKYSPQYRPAKFASLWQPSSLGRFVWYNLNSGVVTTSLFAFRLLVGRDFEL